MSVAAWKLVTACSLNYRSMLLCSDFSHPSRGGGGGQTCCTHSFMQFQPSAKMHTAWPRKRPQYEECSCVTGVSPLIQRASSPCSHAPCCTIRLASSQTCLQSPTYMLTHYTFSLACLQRGGANSCAKYPAQVHVGTYLLLLWFPEPTHTLQKAPHSSGRLLP